MALSSTLQISQSSLQDYLTCARRFELRYLQRLAWPAVESEPIEARERQARLGTDFHRLVQQHLLGLDKTILTPSIEDETLQKWWARYLAERPAELGLAGVKVWPELIVTTSLAGHRLLAKMDALVAAPAGRFVIVDWKTSPRQPAREVLERLVQTRLYRFVLATEGAPLNGGTHIDPARISLLYWFTADPANTVRFPYSQTQLEADRVFLQDTLAEIESRARTNDFPLTSELRHCRTCVYRSFCDRGETAGSLDDAPDVEPDETLADLTLDWGQVQEIGY
jgi:CRISPR/Cas system-associated exonuclease Cas4 (RecB family)